MSLALCSQAIDGVACPWLCVPRGSMVWHILGSVFPGDRWCGMSLALWSPEVSKAPQRFRSSKTQLKEAWRNRCLVHLKFVVKLLDLVACPPPPSSPALRPLVYNYLLCHFPDSSVSRIVHPQESRQPPSLGIRLLPSDSDRFGYATKGEPLSPLCICPPTQRLLYCLRSFSTRSFSSNGVSNSLFELCLQHGFKYFANRWPEISWFSLTARVF